MNDGIPCFESTGRGRKQHTCFVLDRGHTGDHLCCCGHEWPVEPPEPAQKKRRYRRAKRKARS